MNSVKKQMPTGELTLKVDEARFPLDWLIGFAARANAKRGFLFLSKVLGKHWPVTPRAMQAIHDDLAAQIPPQPARPRGLHRHGGNGRRPGPGRVRGVAARQPEWKSAVFAQLALPRGHGALLRVRGIAQPRATPVPALVGRGQRAVFHRAQPGADRR